MFANPPNQNVFSSHTSIHLILLFDALLVCSSDLVLRTDWWVEV